MTDQTCASRRCSKPTKSATLCTDDLVELLVNLSDVAEFLFPNLELQFRRGARYSFGRAASSGETPESFNEKVRDEIAHLSTVLVSWQGKLADHLGQPVRYPAPLQPLCGHGLQSPSEASRHGTRPATWPTRSPPPRAAPAASSTDPLTAGTPAGAASYA